MVDRSQAERLARPIPHRYVSQVDKGSYKANYVGHAVITQIALAVLGPFDFKAGDLILDPDGLVVGIYGTVTAVIDGQVRTVTEIGDVDDDSGKKHTNNGQRAKNAASDALKRCLMRFGLGLDQWTKDGYFLYDELSKREDPLPLEIPYPHVPPAHLQARSGS